jgi:hypothetical protein
MLQGAEMWINKSLNCHLNLSIFLSSFPFTGFNQHRNQRDKADLGSYINLMVNRLVWYFIYTKGLETDEVADV